MTSVRGTAEVLRHEAAVMRAAHPVAFPLVDRLLAGRAARRVPGVGVVVADPALVRQVLTDATFRKDGPGSSGALWAGVLGHRTLIGMDGAPHRTLRRALGELFTPAAADDVCRRVLTTPLVAATADLVAGRPVDLVALTRRCATAVIASLVGLLDDDADAQQVDDASELLLDAGDEVLGMVRLRTRRLSPAQVSRVRELFAPMTRAATAAYDRADGTHSVLGRLPALGISRSQAPSLAAVLLLTGTETLTSAAPRAVAMLHDAGLLDDVAADRSRLQPFLAEALRLATPSPAMLRRATVAGRLGPVDVRPGDRVLVATWWATRLPDGFRPERACPAAARNLWFGAGPHFCLGAPLATAELAAVAGAVLDAHEAARPVRVVQREAATHVLVPAYRRLVLRTGTAA